MEWEEKLKKKSQQIYFHSSKREVGGGVLGKVESSRGIYKRTMVKSHLKPLTKCK